MIGPARRPALLMLLPGPVYGLRENLTARLEGLSAFCNGRVVTTGPEAGEHDIGAFTVEVIQSEGRRKGKTVLEFYRSAIRSAAVGSAEGNTARLVITYDPLRTGMIGARAARMLYAPLIVEVNGDYTSPANYAELRPAAMRWLQRRLYMSLEARVLRQAQGIKALYPGQLEFFSRSLRGKVVRTYSNLVDVEQFRPIEDRNEILFVGHPYYLKGVDLLIAAFTKVSAEFPEWHLKLLGWFPDRSLLDAAIGGHPRVSIHPPVYRRDLPEHMGRCGIFVLPSRTEAMGRVLIEAMACEKPRIGSDAGGIPTVIRDEVDGLLFRAGDGDHLARQLARLMADPELRRRLGRTAAERVRTELSAQAYFDKTREFYDAVLRSVTQERP